MIGKVRLGSPTSSKEFVIKAVKTQKWLIIHQEFLVKDGLFRSIYLPGIEALVLSPAGLQFDYDRERYYISNKTGSLFYFLLETLEISYN